MPLSTTKLSQPPQKVYFFDHTTKWYSQDQCQSQMSLCMQCVSSADAEHFKLVYL